MDKKLYLSRFSNNSCKAIEENFKFSKKFEEKFKKDVSEFSVQEVFELVKSRGFVETTSLRNFVSNLRNYAKWCESKGFLTDKNAGFLVLKFDDFDEILISNISKEFIESETSLLQILEDLYSFVDGFLAPPISILLWYGVKCKELPNLLQQQVSLESRRVYDSIGEGISGVFSDKATEVLQKYINCDGFDDGNRVFRKDKQNPMFFKRMIPLNSQIEGKLLNKNSFIREMQMASDKSYKVFGEKYLSPINIYRSGRYARLWDLEQSGVDIIAPENREIFEGVWRHSKKYFDALKMYKLWRKAFK